MGKGKRCRHAVGLWALVVAAGGCSGVSNPWVFDAPPAIGADEVLISARPGGTVIKIATFGDPAVAAVRWRNDVGSGMSEYLRRALLNETDFNVLIEPARAGRAANGPTSSEADYIVTGKVTDFNHTSLLSRKVARWGLLRRRSEAVVAIEFRVVDAHSGRVVAADHIYGTASASRRPPRKLYNGLDFQAYLFWSTPLGRASRQALGRVVHRIRQIVPSHSGESRIIAIEGLRKVTLVGGRATGFASGQEYLLYMSPPGTRKRSGPVYDAEMGRPLLVRISRVRKNSSTGWLLGQPPAGVDLRGAVLVRQTSDGSEKAATVDDSTALARGKSASDG